MYMCKLHFFCALASSSFPPADLFSCPLLLSTQGGRVYTCKFGPRPGSVGHAQGVQIHASWLFFRGVGFRDAEPCRTVKTPQVKLFALLLLSHRPSSSSSSVLRGIHGATAVANQAPPCVAVADGASVCACLCCPSCRPRKKERAPVSVLLSTDIPC